MSIKINRITFGIANIERTKQFYDTWLCIEPYKLTTNQLLYQLDNIILAFVPLVKLADDADVNDESEGFDGVILSRYVNSIKDVDQMLRNAENAGGFLTKRASKISNDTYSGYFSDLDGHMWEVAFHMKI
jgi:predicted lactoylglutathione lyase